MRSINKDSVDNIQVILMKNYFLFYQIQELAGNVGITDEDEIKIMVNFYHDLGLLIHYGSSGTIDNVLRNTVVLQPHWLVDMFRSVVLAKPKTDKVSFKNYDSFCTVYQFFADSINHLIFFMYFQFMWSCKIFYMIILGFFFSGVSVKTNGKLLNRRASLMIPFWKISGRKSACRSQFFWVWWRSLTFCVLPSPRYFWNTCCFNQYQIKHNIKQCL